MPRAKTTPTYPSKGVLVGPRKTNPETFIQRQIKALLELDGWFVWKIHQSLGSTPGIADLVAVADGRTVWIEVKTQRGRQSPAQEQFEWAIKKAGGEYILARSEEDVKPLLRRVRLG